MHKKIILACMIGAMLLSSTTRVEAAEDTWIPKDIQYHIYDIASEYKVCPEMIIAMVERESSGLSHVSNGSCKGLLQINESFQKDRMRELGVTNLYDPRSNLLVGIDYISDMAAEYDDIAAVLMHYHGEKGVEDKLSQNKISKYATSIMNRSMELERLHKK